MNFKGTIVITDPCYLDNGDCNLDLWEASGYGEDLSVFGCSQWISEGTIYGDWSCTTYKGDKEKLSKFFKKANEIRKPLWRYFDSEEELTKVRDTVYEELNKLIESYGSLTELGQFCADAGMVCVVYLDEVLKINPGFKKWAEEHTWCATIIENFDGDVNYEVDEDMDSHIVGKGNIDFYTTQTGL